MRRITRLVPAVGASVLALIALPVLGAHPVDADGPAGTPRSGGATAAPGEPSDPVPSRRDPAGITHLTADLGPVNRSGASTTATATLRGDKLAIRIVSRGLAPGLPHAQHIHLGGSHSCPAPGATGEGMGGQVRSSDAKKSVGDIAVSLTTTGDTSPASSYALDRFPVGNGVYQRTITVSDEVAAQLRANKGVIEQHGVDSNHSGRYDGAARSDVKPDLPEEVSNTAACGKLVPRDTAVPAAPMPIGGVAAGGGGTA